MFGCVGVRVVVEDDGQGRRSRTTVRGDGEGRREDGKKANESRGSTEISWYWGRPIEIKQVTIWKLSWKERQKEERQKEEREEMAWWLHSVAVRHGTVSFFLSNITYAWYLVCSLRYRRAYLAATPMDGTCFSDIKNDDVNVHLLDIRKDRVIMFHPYNESIS